MCLDDQILSAYLDGELAEPWKTQVEEHLAYCDVCKSRLESLRELSKAVKATSPSEEKIAKSEAEVLAFMENNYLKKPQKKSNFFTRRINVGMPAILSVAAAFVLIFVGAFVFFGSNGNQTAAIMPGINTAVNSENIVQVRATDSATTAKSLDAYSLEDILKSLDARGYDVDIRLKGIVPLEDGETAASVATPEEASESEEIAN